MCRCDIFGSYDVWYSQTYWDTGRLLSDRLEVYLLLSLRHQKVRRGHCMRTTLTKMANRIHKTAYKETPDARRLRFRDPSCEPGTNYWAEHTPNLRLEVLTIITDAVVARVHQHFQRARKRYGMYKGLVRVSYAEEERQNPSG